MNHASLWSCLSASTPAWVLRGKVSETMLLTSLHEPKMSVSHVASSEWERKWMGRRGRRVPALKSAQHGLGTSGTVEWLEETSRTHARCQKLCEAKPNKTCPEPVVDLPSCFFIERKGKLKWELPAYTWLNSLLSREEGLLQVWRAEVQKWWHSWAGKLPQWKRLSKHYLINNFPFPSCSVSLA